MMIKAACVLLLAASPASAQDGAFRRDILPFLQKYCTKCHDADTRKAELDLEVFSSEARVLRDRRTWKKVWEMLHIREMPPVGKRQPSFAERQRVTDWIEAVLARPDASGVRNPGHVPPRRLSPVEYNNTLYDLLRVNRKRSFYDPERHGGMPKSVRFVLQRQFPSPLVHLPAEPVAHGFDNVAEAMTLSPFLLEKYLHASEKLVQREDVRRSFRGRLGNPNAPLEERHRRGRAVVADYVRLAFRRPPARADLDRFVSLYDFAVKQGAPPEDAVAAALRGILAAPRFLLRIEEGVAAEEKGTVRPLSDHELASRLSYFLWSTMPDRELSKLADDGKLRDPDVLASQVRRMIRHRKAEELAKNFTTQWLQIQNIKSHAPDQSVLPAKEWRLKYMNESMMTEVLLLFATIMAEDRSVLELIDSDYAWMNVILQRVYGLEQKKPDGSRGTHGEWFRYKLADRRRGGVITSGAMLMTTSNPTRTNPVKRGKWILEVILGQPPPPPLPDVPDLDATPAAEDGLPLRVKLERHRSDPGCASCHRRLDPLGLALENFNAVGVWREKDGPVPIDAKGTLTDGSSFDGPVEMKDLILNKKREFFVRNLASQLMTYALGRPMDYYDVATVRKIAEAVAADRYRFSTLIVEIVQSYPFRYLNTKAGE